MRLSPALLCLFLLALGASSRARYIVADRRLSEDDDFYGMPPTPEQAQIAAESPSLLQAAVHLAGSLPQTHGSQAWDPQIRSFLVRSKQPGSGCRQLSPKQPLQLRTPDAPANVANYFFRGDSSVGGASQGDGTQSDLSSGSQLLASLQDSQTDGSASQAPCADLPVNIFAALSRDGYVRHAALSGDQPEF